jgi:hypothetical protein
MFDLFPFVWLETISICKYTNKRARNMKFTSIFFMASESIVEIYLKYSEKIFQKTEIWKRERQQGRKSPFLQRYSA